jgi:hypothetical protein
MVIFLNDSGILDTEHSLCAVVSLETEKPEQFDNIKEISEIMDLDFSVEIGIFATSPESEPVIERLFRHLIEKDTFENIYIDSAKPEPYINTLKKILEEKAISPEKLKIVDDNPYRGLEIARQIANVVKQYYSAQDDHGNKKVFEELKSKNKISAQFIFQASN